MLAEWGAMTGTLGANAVWPFMPTGIRHMELKAQPRSRLHNLHSELPQGAEGWR